MQMSGGMAGLASFLFLHPIDVLKSLVQSVPPGSKSSLRELVRHEYARDGHTFLFRGIVPTCLRAFPVSAIIFVVQEKIVGC